MPFNKKSKKNNLPGDVFQKREAEKQSNRTNTPDLHLKQPSRPEKGAAPPFGGKREDLVNHFARNIHLVTEEAVKSELKPIQYSMEELTKRVSKMEKQLSFFKQWLGDYLSMYERWMEESKTKERTKREHLNPVIYQEIKVDKLFVDKYEQVNNLGNLGIKDLSGQLNIGTTFENSSNSMEALSEWTEKAAEFQEAMEKLKGLSERAKVEKEKEKTEEELNQGTETSKEK